MLKLIGIVVFVLVAAVLAMAMTKADSFRVQRKRFVLVRSPGRRAFGVR